MPATTGVVMAQPAASTGSMGSSCASAVGPAGATARRARTRSIGRAKRIGLSPASRRPTVHRKPPFAPTVRPRVGSRRARRTIALPAGIAAPDMRREPSSDIRTLDRSEAADVDSDAAMEPEHRAATQSQRVAVAAHPDQHAQPAVAPDDRADVARREPLSCVRIIEAAVRYVDDNCLDELSMRRLGSELGVEAMSLYRYFPSKGALLDAVVGWLLRDLALPDERGYPGLGAPGARLRGVLPEHHAPASPPDAPAHRALPRRSAAAGHPRPDDRRVASGGPVPRGRPERPARAPVVPVGQLPVAPGVVPGRGSRDGLPLRAGRVPRRRPQSRRRRRRPLPSASQAPPSIRRPGRSRSRRAPQPATPRARLASSGTWSRAWYEERTSGPDSTCLKPSASASAFISANSSGWT